MTKLNKSDLKILIVAENASNLFGGEAILPLHYFTFMRKLGVSCFLLTHNRNRASLDAQLPTNIQQYIFYIPDAGLQKFLYSISKKMPGRLYSLTIGLIIQHISNKSFKKMTKKIIKSQSINILHQPIPVSPRQPSNMFNFEIPVIIGPMNGGMTFPPGLALESFSEKIIQSMLITISGLMNFIIPGKKKAALLLVANSRTRKALPSSRSKNIVTFPENGVDLDFLDSISIDKSTKKPNFHLVYLGRLEELKAVDLLLHAVEKLRNKHDFSLTIIGDGPDKSRISKLISKLQLENCVEMTGYLPQKTAFAILKCADALILPSLHECGGAVVLEAMACSKPVLATNWGGPRDYITKETGILIDTGSNPSEFTKNIEKSINTIIQDTELAKKMGIAGRERVEKYFSWEQKALAMYDYYAQYS